LRNGCFLEDAGCVYLLCQFYNRTEHLVEFGGQVFDLLLERDGGSFLVLLVVCVHLLSFLFEIHFLILFRCVRHRLNLVLALPGEAVRNVEYIL
jgi:hypothetical protein